MRYGKLVILAVSLALAVVASAQTPAKAPSKAALAAGGKLFHDHCAACHGVDGKGVPATMGGNYDPQSIEPERRVKPADLTTLSERNAGKFPADRVRDSIYSKGSIRAHGTPAMPAWGDVFYNQKSDPKLLEKRVSDLTAYIESLQTTKKQ